MLKSERFYPFVQLHPRTGKSISFNPKKPYTLEAYKSWARFKNENCKEKFCHQTGKPSNGKTSFKNPILN
ncbi:MAG: hypothetical protein ACI8RP_002020 [Urechidicola sp.]|jgi:hypothetical protein